MAEGKKPGIMWVNSDVIKPEKLSRDDFDFWYIDDHIPDVVSRSGVSSASRYSHVVDGSTPKRKLEFLTIYNFEDIDFMKSDEFRTLEGVVPGPNRWSIFENVEFDTREYELVQVDEKKTSKSAGPPILLLYAAMSHSSDKDLDEWYRGEHVRTISECPNYRRTRRFKLVSRSLLSSFQRIEMSGPTWLSLHEFDGETLPWTELAATDETEWAKRVIPGITNIDYGCFRLSKAFGKDNAKKDWARL